MILETIEADFSLHNLPWELDYFSTTIRKGNIFVQIDYTDNMVREYYGNINDPYVEHEINTDIDFDLMIDLLKKYEDEGFTNY